MSRQHEINSSGGGVMFRDMHFMCYKNRLIATKLDSTYWGHQPTAHNVYETLRNKRDLPLGLSLANAWAIAWLVFVDYNVAVLQKTVV